MNVILLIVDTLRYDHIGAHGNDWIETPNIDRLAKRSWIFDRAYAFSYPTIPHRTDVMTGRYGRPFNPWMPLRFDVTTLPRVLAEAGYATQLIHDTPHLVNGGHAFDWPFAAWTFARGAEVDRPWLDDQAFTYLDNWARDPLFDYLGDPEMHEVRDHTCVSYIRAHRKRRRPEDWNVARLFLTAGEFLRDNAKRDNFFLWLDCFDPHEPWDAPPEFVLKYDKTPGYDGRIDPRAFLGGARKGGANGPLSEAVVRRQKALYAAKVSWVDHWLGRLLDTLDETGLARNTAIVLTADHGTNVGERGGFGKALPVNEQEAHVPLLVHVPDGSTGRSDIVAQPQDVFATILGIAGAARPQDCDGHDVRSLAEGGRAGPRAVAIAGTSSHGWRGNPEDIVLSVFGPEHYLNVAARPEACRLFRYGSTENVAGDGPAVVADLRREGLDQLARTHADPALVEWLRSEGKTPLPESVRGWPGPANWSTYWGRNYNQW